jgi:hypothetical protein
MIWIERRHVYLVALFLGHLLLIGGIVYLVTNRIERRFLQELKDTRNALEQIKENELLLAQDLNNARSVLGLNVRTYDFLVKEEDRTPSEKTAYSPLFQAVNTILALKERQEREALLMNTLQSKEVSNLIRLKGLELRKDQGKVELQRKGVPYFSFSLSKDKPFVVESYLGARWLPDLKGPFALGLSSFLQEQLPILEAHLSRIQQLRTQFLATFEKPRIQSLASQKGLVRSPLEESDDEARLQYLLKVEPTLTKVEAALSYRKGTFFVGKEPFDTIETFERALEQALANADTWTSKELRLDSILTSLRTQMKDSGFQRYLQSKKLKISDRGRENEEYRFIDLLEEKGTRIGSIGIQKIKGEVFLFDKDDVPITSFRMFSFPSPMIEKKKSLNPASP